MCAPKITPRPRRVIRVEVDPYRRGRDRLNLGPIVRKIYEDGSRALYVGDNHVWAIRYTGDYFLDDTIIELGFADGTTSVRFSEASPGEGAWLQESMEDFGLSDYEERMSSLGS